MKIKCLVVILALVVLWASSVSALKNDGFRDWEAKNKEELIILLIEDFNSHSFLRENPVKKEELENFFRNFILKSPAPKKKGRARTLEERKAKYRANFLYEEGYRLGREYLKKYMAVLLEAEKKYLVPKEIIVSILWVETRFSENIGSSNALRGLYNLYFKKLYREKDPEKVKDYRLQIAYFFALCNKKGLNPETVLGSYAGALGIPQFMPYSYWKFGVDGDGDGEVDLFNSHADSIFSAANYLAAHGWSEDGKRAVRRYNNDSAYVYAVFAYAQALKK